MGRLSRIFEELNEPDDFHGRPIMYAGNVCGHIWIGFNAVTLLTCFIWSVMGSYPDQKIMVLLVVAIYFIWWELSRWNGFDSIEDTLFVFFGTATYLTIDMQFVMGRLAVSLLIINIFLICGILRRAKNG